MKTCDNNHDSPKITSLEANDISKQLEVAEVYQVDVSFGAKVVSFPTETTARKQLSIFSKFEVV